MVSPVQTTFERVPEARQSRTTLLSLHGWVGGDLSHAPYLSPFGALVILSRLNRFGRKDLHAAFGLRLLANEDPSRALAFSSKRLAEFSHAIRVEPEKSAGWRLCDWLPFQGDATEGWKDSWTTRICMPCAKAGFHTWLFQLPWITRCPWHRTRLIAECPSCHRPLASSFLDGKALLRCACGIDFFNRRAALRAGCASNRARDRILANYLDDARSGRSTSYLFAPVIQSKADAALTTLIAQPGFERPATEQQPHVRHIKIGCPQAWRWSKIRADLSLLGKELGGKNTLLIELPMSMVEPMRRVASSIASRVPPGSLVPTEAQKLISDGMVRTKPGNARSGILYLPVQVSGGRAYLFVNSIPPSVLEAIGKILQMARNAWTDDATTAIVYTTVRTILLRGYADGLRIVLGRFIPELYDNPKLSPSEHDPWILVKKDNVGVSRIEIVWARTESRRST